MDPRSVGFRMKYDPRATVAVDAVKTDGKKKKKKKNTPVKKVDSTEGATASNRPCPFVVHCGKCDRPDCWFSHSADLCAQAKNQQCEAFKKYGKCFKQHEFFKSPGPNGKMVSKCPYQHPKTSGKNVDSIKRDKTQNFVRQGNNRRP